MVPLINVVFLLMVFFLLAGTLGRRDDLPIRPPVSTSEQSRDDGALELAVLGDGRALLDGVPVALADLGPIIGRRFDVPGATKLIRIELRADGAVAMQDLRPLLRAISETGAEDVRLLTRMN